MDEFDALTQEVEGLGSHLEFDLGMTAVVFMSLLRDHNVIEAWLSPEFEEEVNGFIGEWLKKYEKELEAQGVEVLVMEEDDDD